MKNNVGLTRCWSRMLFYVMSIPFAFYSTPFYPCCTSPETAPVPTAPVPQKYFISQFWLIAGNSLFHALSVTVEFGVI